MSDSLRPHGLQSTRLLCPWKSPGNGTGLGCHSLFPGIFSTQESNQVSYTRQTVSFEPSRKPQVIKKLNSHKEVTFYPNARQERLALGNSDDTVNS